MTFSINDFKAQLVGGGARPTLFKVQITNPILGTADFKTPFMISSATIPESTVGTYSLPYFGREIKYAGDRRFSDWTVRVINDEDFSVRNAMEAWSNAINTHVTNTRVSPSVYKAQAQIFQYGKDGTVLREYTFQGLFPSNISDIQTGWARRDEYEEFSVTFQYDLWTVTGGNTGNPIT